jgi:hypothetical protein
MAITADFSITLNQRITKHLGDCFTPIISSLPYQSNAMPMMSACENFHKEFRWFTFKQCLVWTQNHLGIAPSAVFTALFECATPKGGGVAASAAQDYDIQKKDRVGA